jgi:hypothetical protein
MTRSLAACVAARSSASSAASTASMAAAKRSACGRRISVMASLRR